LASEEQMQQISGLVNAPDILAVVKQKWVNPKDLLKAGKPLFFLDGVQDPGHVGTIIRVADWFGFGGVILGSGTADVYHPKVVQATMGSITAFGFARSEINEIFESGVMENIRVLDMEGQSLDQAPLPKSGIYVLGSEGRGVSRDWLEAIPSQHRLTIQGAHHKMAESLNVGVAAGIVAQQVMIRG
jgi:TrmH family RNA methyltransferase